MIRAEMTMKTWNEIEVLSTGSGTRLTKVDAEFTYAGGMSGSSKAVLLLQYEDEKNGVYEGWEVFSGKLDGKSGSLMLRHTGTFSAEDVRVRFAMVPGSGTEGLTDAVFECTLVMKGHGPYPMEIHV